MGETPTPDEFEVYIGSFASRSYGVWWDGDRLVYESFADGYGEREQSFVAPSRAQWERFWRTMDELGVWEWDNRYVGERPLPTTAIRDGTHWSLSIRQGARSVASGGDDDRSERRFDEFADAVSRLLGGAAFA